MPAACMFSIIRPAVAPAGVTPLPLSNTTSLLPVSRKVTVKGMRMLSVGRKLSARTFCTSSSGALRTKPWSGRWAKPSCTVVMVKLPTLKR